MKGGGKGSALNGCVITIGDAPAPVPAGWPIRHIEIKFTRSKAKDALGIQITNNPNAPEVRLTEEQIRDDYPWDYDQLTAECRKRYAGFKLVQKFHDLRKKLAGDARFGHVRHLDPGNPKSTKKPFFNPNILGEFDQHYTRAPGGSA